MPFHRDDHRRQRHGPRRRADRGAQDRRSPSRCSATTSPATTSWPTEYPRKREAAARPSSPSTSSTRWGTCDRRRSRPRPPGRRGWTAPGPARQGRAARVPLPLRRQPERDLRAPPRRPALRACACPPPERSAGPRQGHLARVADHRGARRHRRPAYRGRRRVHGRRPCSAGPSTSWASSTAGRRWTSTAGRGRRRSTPTSTRAPGLAYELAEGIALLSKVDWKAKGLEDLGRPDGFHERQVDRWTAFLERIKGRELAGLRRGVRLAAQPQADRLHPRPDARRLPVRQRDVPARRAGAARGDRRLGDGHGRRPEARSRLGRAELAGGHRRGGTVGVATSTCAACRRGEVVAHYAKCPGRQVDDIDYYCILAKWKLAIVLEQGFQRAGDDEKLLAFGPIVLDSMRSAAELAETTRLPVRCARSARRTDRRR